MVLERLAGTDRRSIGLADQVAEVDQQEVRWHLAQMLPRRPLDPVER